ncbi:hypothetical protein AB0C34_01010 [Nocardia sp. NPDC049220]|uniref:hypothetical protein n=1 Tax=Nocardia sp. NPDC049220 TaxID=3155273 RepID=UPI0033C4787A
MNWASAENTEHEQQRGEGPADTTDPPAPRRPRYRATWRASGALRLWRWHGFRQQLLLCRGLPSDPAFEPDREGAWRCLGGFPESKYAIVEHFDPYIEQVWETKTEPIRQLVAAGVHIPTEADWRELRHRTPWSGPAQMTSDIIESMEWTNPRHPAGQHGTSSPATMM